jgi:hypothetical protein
MLKGNDDPIMIREKWVQVEKEYNQASTQAKPVLESLNA